MYVFGKSIFTVLDEYRNKYASLLLAGRVSEWFPKTSQNMKIMCRETSLFYGEVVVL